MAEQYETSTVGELVARDYRCAAVLEHFHIDYCCGGRRSIVDACLESGADPEAVKHALESLPSSDRPVEDVRSWSIRRLIDHIVSTHHAYVRAELPAMIRECAKIAAVHGGRHVELPRVAAVVEELSAELLQHMEKEELVLFPFLTEFEGDEAAQTPPFVTVNNPMRMMEREHVEAGHHLKTLRALTQDYAVPDDGCATYRVAMQRLEAFERDLHRHIHLENNVLFPKARAIESERLPWRE